MARGQCRGHSRGHTEAMAELAWEEFPAEPITRAKGACPTHIPERFSASHRQCEEFLDGKKQGQGKQVISAGRSHAPHLRPPGQLWQLFSG